MPSNFDVIDGKFADYMALVEQTASTLTTVKGNLDDAIALCGEDENDNPACADVGELTAHVQGLEGDLTQLTADNVALETFKDEIQSVLAGESFETDDEIVAALQAQIAETTQAATDATDAITTLNSQIDGLESEISTLEGEMAIALTTIGNQGGDIADLEGDLDAMTDLYDAQVIATSDLQSAYDTQNELLGDVQADLSDAQDLLITETSTNNSLTNQLNAATQATADAIALGVENVIANQNAADVLLASTIAASDADAADAAAAAQSAADAHATALSNAQDAYDVLIAAEEGISAGLQASLDAANTTINESSAIITELDAQIVTHLDTIAGLQEDKANLQASLDEQIALLTTQEGISEGLVAELESMTADWTEANDSYNETAATLTSTEITLAETESSLASQISTAEGLQAELVIANATIDEHLDTIESISAELATAESDIDEFNTLSGTIGGAITSLEGQLTSLGYTPVTEPEFAGGGFDGSGWSSFQGEGASEFQQLLFRGIKARRAYLNMSGGNTEIRDIDNNVPTMDFNADGSDTQTNGLLKLGAIAGLIYLGSKLLKK